MIDKIFKILEIISSDVVKYNVYIDLIDGIFYSICFTYNDKDISVTYESEMRVRMRKPIGCNIDLKLTSEMKHKFKQLFDKIKQNCTKYINLQFNLIIDENN